MDITTTKDNSSEATSSVSKEEVKIRKRLDNYQGKIDKKKAQLQKLLKKVKIIEEDLKDDQNTLRLLKIDLLEIKFNGNLDELLK